MHHPPPILSFDLFAFAFLPLEPLHFSCTREMLVRYFQGSIQAFLPSIWHLSRLIGVSSLGQPAVTRAASITISLITALLKILLPIQPYFDSDRIKLASQLKMAFLSTELLPVARSYIKSIRLLFLSIM